MFHFRENNSIMQADTLNHVADGSLHLRPLFFPSPSCQHLCRLTEPKQQKKKNEMKINSQNSVKSLLFLLLRIRKFSHSRSMRREVIDTPTVHHQCGCAQAYAALLLD